jgi:hypothetical protein
MGSEDSIYRTGKRIEIDYLLQRHRLESFDNGRPIYLADICVKVSASFFMVTPLAVRFPSPEVMPVPPAAFFDRASFGPPFPTIRAYTGSSFVSQ